LRRFVSPPAIDTKTLPAEVLCEPAPEVGEGVFGALGGRISARRRVLQMRAIDPGDGGRRHAEIQMVGHGIRGNRGQTTVCHEGKGAIGDRPRFATESPAPAAKKTKNGLTLDNSGDSLLKFPRMTGGRNAKENSTCYGHSLLNSLNADGR